MRLKVVPSEAVIQYNPARLLELISELHALSADNKRFIETKVIKFSNRLEKIVEDANGIGWGYYDTIKGMWEE